MAVSVYAELYLKETLITETEKSVWAAYCLYTEFCWWVLCFYHPTCCKFVTSCGQPSVTIVLVSVKTDMQHFFFKCTSTSSQHFRGHRQRFSVQEKKTTMWTQAFKETGAKTDWQRGNEVLQHWTRWENWCGFLSTKAYKPILVIQNTIMNLKLSIMFPLTGS